VLLDWVVHGAVADKTLSVHPESKISVSSVAAIRSDGDSLKLMKIDLTYGL
jgi:hypothetical protein